MKLETEEEIVFNLARLVERIRENIKAEKSRLLKKYGEKLFENEEIVETALEEVSINIFNSYISTKFGDKVKVYVLSEDRYFNYPEIRNTYLLLFDPLDGTINYISGIGQATVSIGVSRGYDITDMIGGVVARIRKNETLISINSTNYRYYKMELDEILPNGKFNRDIFDITKSRAVIDMNVMRYESRLKTLDLLRAVKSPRYFGCVSDSLLNLGEGKLDIVVSSGRPWDYAAAMKYALNSGSYVAFLYVSNAREIFRNESVKYVAASNEDLLYQALDILMKRYNITRKDDRILVVEN